jgi:DNA-binding NtrC family response regulator
MEPTTAATVLVVEDEPLIRMHAVDMIESAGWTALEATDCHDALRVLAASGPVDVLFTDVNMPGDMDGLALAETVHQLHPGVELVVTSGKQVIAPEALPDHGTFLSKPYGLDELIGTIGSKLGAAART